MRRAILPLALLLSACPDEPVASDTQASTTSTTPGPTTTPTATTSDPGACVPGKSEPCTCPGGSAGARVCAPDGADFEPCQCQGATTSTTDVPDPTSSTTTALTLTTTDDPATTTGTSSTADTTAPSDTSDTSTSETTDIPAGPCMGTVTVEQTPADAMLSGDWLLTMSNLGEGQVASLVDPANKHSGAVRYTIDVPCDATWYIWLRVLDQAANDSYRVTLDGDPDPAAIFDADCGNSGNSYKWARLNWRDPQSDPCEYLQNPWAPQWTTGTHQIEILYEESPAIGRVLLTTDMNAVPK